VDGRSAWPASSSSIEIQRRHVIGGTMPLRDAFFFRATNPSKELSIILIASSVALLVIGEGVGVAIALLVERCSEAASLAVFFALLVVAIVAAWKLAVRLTQPARLHHRPRSS
jgi:hypothetical protein